MKWALISIILGIILFFGISFFIEPAGIEIIPFQQKETSTLLVGEEQPIKIILVGDIMLDRGVEYMVEKEGKGDFRFPFIKIADYLKGADIVFGNLEGVISDKGIKVGSIYSFRANPKAIEGLIFAGFNVLSLANNHAFDYGREALEGCLAKLSNAGISYVGAGFTEKEAYSPFIKEIGDTKIGFLTYTNLGPETWRASGENSGIALVNQENLSLAKQQIKEAKKQVDILIVSLHSGEEYQKEPTQFQIEFSEMAIDAGANLTVGHHSHIVQPNEKYGNGYIFYSLGNFIFDQDFSEETMKGQILEVLIKNKQIKEVIAKETKINNFFQPEFAEKIIEDTQFQISLSSTALEQGDTLLIKIPSLVDADEIGGWFGTTKINFSNLGENLVGIAGIDAKKKPGRYKLTINLPDNYEIEKEINIVKRDFPITELLITKELEERGLTIPKIEENVAKENLVLQEVLSIFTPEVYFDRPFIYPLEKIKDVGAFGNIRKSGEISLQHLGVDLEANIDTPVYAINDGTVRLSQELTNYGKIIIIDHGMGIFSLYLHLDEFKVFERKAVKKGEIIALSGNTGYSIAPHLHLGVKISGSSVDPLRFIETTEKEMLK
ncbi:MAG: hypothetical protein COX35_00035 [Candidatus Nealsonbacteria bacterium CG23_combo_of_CG06-09_8_20_14_all_37_18]|uniref:Capsule synthesis protein CapA domain-containing protein n=2 Tax=Candidatus Nealsoniibacteriota TaxID=1817911 RepID=A0A2G9Z1G0_9BACT|nr:MAG: hypothetical protein COX35_00035 [Candidatus Nealsonbacteria bacterium CG23_combo_of_CG06-09_8_20_14_all_37_18]